MSYTIPSGTFHTTEVSPDTVQAALYFFDSSCDFIKDARVLGPVSGNSFFQSHDPAGMTSTALAGIVNEARSWEISMKQGQYHFRYGDREHALKAFDSALNLCTSAESVHNFPHYKQTVLLELGKLNRRLGRYEQARDILEKLLMEMEPNDQRVGCSGELGVVYRHLDRLPDAKHAFEVQYDTAKQSKDERMACRAIANLGMVHYQLSKLDQHHCI
ncbi:MAG: hypothetical protein Q9225_007894 [Loekoesia sp. 1 TL-2023]